MDRPTGHDFDALARWYDAGLRFGFGFAGGEARLRRRIMSLLRRGGLRSDARVLEVGAGTGSNLQALEELFPACFMAGLDLSLPMLRRATGKRFSRAPLLVQGDAVHLPFPDASFDAVVAIFVLHEMSAGARRQAAAEMKRVLCPGGFCLVADWSRPRAGWGRVLFHFIRLFESREALDFANGGVSRLLEGLLFTREASTFFLGGLMAAELYRGGQ